jgi:hypothetical protein
MYNMLDQNEGGGLQRTEFDNLVFVLHLEFFVARTPLLLKLRSLLLAGTTATGQSGGAAAAAAAAAAATAADGAAAATAADGAAGGGEENRDTGGVGGEESAITNPAITNPAITRGGEGGRIDGRTDGRIDGGRSGNDATHAGTTIATTTATTAAPTKCCGPLRRSCAAVLLRLHIGITTKPYLDWFVQMVVVCNACLLLWMFRPMLIYDRETE